MEVKIEIGVMDEGGDTVWPAEFRTFAKRNKINVAMSHVLNLARWEKVTSIRTTRVS